MNIDRASVTDIAGAARDCAQIKIAKPLNIREREPRIVACSSFLHCGREVKRNARVRVFMQQHHILHSVFTAAVGAKFEDLPDREAGAEDYDGIGD